jgi:hypothetical protein
MSFLTVSSVLAVALASFPGAARAVPEAGPLADPHRIVRGMTVSCQTWGWEWGSDAMLSTMDELKPMGVNWIAIHPYGRVHSDGSVSWRQDYAGAEWLTRPIHEAHRRGLKILIKPHLAYWGAGFAWAGDIAFDTPEQWQRFFGTQQQWLVTLMSAAKDADAVCVGTELDKTVDHELEWRKTISAVRQVAGAMTVTYAANWDSYERVRFWDALDVICVHGYFPLSRSAAIPVDTELVTNARDWVTQLEGYGRAHNRKVLIGELGYDISLNAALRPWESGDAARPAQKSDALAVTAVEHLQARCLTASLEAIEKSDVVVGAFLWKWFPGGPESSRGEDFLMSTPAMRAVIARHWGPAQTEVQPNKPRAP